LVSHFSEFSEIFYTIYNNQQFPLTIEVYLLRKGPWKVSGLCNVAHMGGWPARLPEFGEAGGAPDWGRGGGGLGVC
jgi:hypothetical protein